MSPCSYCSLFPLQTLFLIVQAIWKEEQDGSVNSLQSLDDHVDKRLQNMGRRETSLDSRLSGGSTQSELTTGDPKRKKGLFGKLKKLAKSRSEDNGSQEDFRTYKVRKSKKSESACKQECGSHSYDRRDDVSL